MENEILVLSGRTFVARIPFASSDALRSAIGDGAMAEDGRQPLAGDVRFSATLSGDTRGKHALSGKCVGTLTASIFDGACWQRFDITTLTGMFKFSSEVQLRGVLGWANRAAHEAAGRSCRRAVGANGFPVYELLPEASVPPSPPPAPAPPPSPIVTTTRGVKHGRSSASSN